MAGWQDLLQSIRGPELERSGLGPDKKKDPDNPFTFKDGWGMGLDTLATLGSLKMGFDQHKLAKRQFNHLIANDQRNYDMQRATMNNQVKANYHMLPPSRQNGMGQHMKQWGYN